VFAQGAALSAAQWEGASYLNFQLGVFEAVKVLFAAAFGACIGSLTNVLVYRIPRGLDFVTPTSRCTSCDTPLTWRENVPIFGWLLLRGRCRFCRSKISPEYVLVEAFVALLWAFTFAALYLGSGNPTGVSFAAIQPEWGLNGFALTWPLYLMLVLLFSCLVAMTLVDAKTFTIPPVLTNVPTVLGLVAHVGFAVYVQHWSAQGRLPVVAKGWHWAIATPGPNGWPWVGAAIGGVLGLVLGNLLLKFKMLRRSFEDYAAWEEAALKEARAQAAAPGDAGPTSLQPASQLDNVHPHLWVQYPHARREVFRELLFLAPAMGLAYVGAFLAVRLAGAFSVDPVTQAKVFSTPVPLWLDVIAGVLLGYLIGGGVVWLVRIAGTLGFGKEALGLGDVHMMAAVGACLGWVDPVLAFFGAAFLGVAWYVLGRAFKGVASKVMPFGPFLAMGTILVFFTKPAFEWFFAYLMKLPKAVSLP
jgi:leader peptidase (prepilin peptidase)/N-methyltransferase